MIKNPYIIPITITRLNVGKCEISLSPLFFIIVHRLEVQPNVLWQEKGIKDLKIRKKEIKLFTDDMIIYIENPKEPRKYLWKCWDDSKDIGYKVNMHNQSL